MSPSSSRTRPLKGEASKVYKLFKSGDDENFMVAMSLVDAVLDGLEVLLDDLHKIHRKPCRAYVEDQYGCDRI